MARRILMILLFLSLLPFPAVSSGMEYAQMTNEQLTEMSVLLSQEMASRGLAAHISAKGTKYHARPDCSGMEACMTVLVDELEACGYEPCKRCWKEKV